MILDSELIINCGASRIDHYSMQHNRETINECRKSSILDKNVEGKYNANLGGKTANFPISEGQDLDLHWILYILTSGRFAGILASISARWNSTQSF